jgi:hydroxymethylbilane synthase
LQTPFLKIGTRGSKLALFQANLVRQLLSQIHGVAESDVAIEIISTTGDRVLDRPLAEIGGKGLFTKEIEEALLADHIDIAVHSMKDMAAVLPTGLGILAVLEREDPRDAFLSPIAASIATLPNGAQVGCSSVRRSAQLLAKRPDLKIQPFRGNVDTRLRKLKAGEVAATFLATAGLNRLGLENEITQKISIEDMLPAPAQGIIGIEAKSSNAKLQDLLQPLNNTRALHALTTERAYLQALNGSCRTPIAGHAIINENKIEFKAEALAIDGSAIFKTSRKGVLEDAAILGKDAAEEIRSLSRGIINLQ